jgi:hypothetical protein
MIIFVYSQYSKNFTIALTPLNGDPDLYISTITDSPTALNHEWYAAMPGFDVISISTTDSKYKEGAYYIGVRGFSESYFTLSVSYETTYTQIVEGIPLSSVAKASKYAYFKFDLLKKQRLVINTIPLTYRGDPDIFVSTDISQYPPSREHNQWSRTTAGDDSLVIADADVKTYYIGIYAFGRDTNFQLIVTSEQKSDELIDGQVQRVTSTDNVRFFKKMF